MFDASGKVLQETDYYAFGLQHERPTNTASDNRFLFASYTAQHDGKYYDKTTINGIERGVWRNFEGYVASDDNGQNVAGGGRKSNFAPPVSIPLGIGAALETIGTAAVSLLGAAAIAITLQGDTRKSGIEYFYHYTDKKGYQAIISSNRILPNSKGKVYLTKEEFSIADAFYNLFLGQKTHIGRGDYFIKIGLTPYQRAILMHDPANQPFEYIHPGTLKIFPGMIQESGPNIFK